MPQFAREYLETHQRVICSGCREWILWYKDKKGETVYGCRLGVIPERINAQWHCRYHKSKRIAGGVRIREEKETREALKRLEEERLRQKGGRKWSFAQPLAR